MLKTLEIFLIVNTDENSPHCGKFSTGSTPAYWEGITTAMMYHSADAAKHHVKSPQLQGFYVPGKYEIRAFALVDFAQAHADARKAPAEVSCG